MSYDLEDMVIDRIIERIGEGDFLREIADDIGITRPMIYAILHGVEEEKQEQLWEANENRREHYLQEAAWHEGLARNASRMAENDLVWLAEEGQ